MDEITKALFAMHSVRSTAKDPRAFCNAVLGWCKQGDPVERSNALQALLTFARGHRAPQVVEFLRAQGYTHADLELK